MSNHHIVHVEFSAKDRQEATEFYSKLFGWEIKQIPEMNYATFDTGEKVGGGLNPIQENNPAGTTLIYISTDDIDLTLADAKELGARIAVPKSQVPGFGWFGNFIDPTGNMIGLWTDLEKEF